MPDIRHSTARPPSNSHWGRRVLASVASASAVVIAAFTYALLDGSPATLSVASRGNAPAVRPSPARSEFAPPVPTAQTVPAAEVARVAAPPPVEPAAAAPEAAATTVVPPTPPAVASAPPAAPSAPTPAVVSTPTPAIEVASLLGPPPAAAAIAPAPPPAQALLVLTERERGLVDAMNVRRIAAGLVPLEAADGLTTAARQRSSDMLANNYFAHSSPSGQTWYSILGNMGLSYSAGGENLARVNGGASTSVSLAIDALMASPTHRANILNPAYRRVGVGASSQGDALTIFTTIFTDR